MLWWLEFSILTTQSISFKYNKYNNIYYLNMQNYYYFLLLNKFNLNTLFFFLLDCTILNKKYYLSIETLFYDFKILVSSNINKSLVSVSNIFFSNSWVERELKEVNRVNFINLKDSRKLLLNYNYNSELVYSNYNNIVNDLRL